MTPIAKAPSRLAEATLRDVRAASWQVAVLPWGATEPHNYHLPYATDLDVHQINDGKHPNATALIITTPQLQSRSRLLVDAFCKLIRYQEGTLLFCPIRLTKGGQQPQ